MDERDQEKMLAERKSQHGDFTVHAEITQQLKAVAQKTPGSGYLLMSPTQREAVDMILHKIGRILAGNPNHHDHWRDIMGYSKITLDRLPPEAQ